MATKIGQNEWYVDSDNDICVELGDTDVYLTKDDLLKMLKEIEEKEFSS
jgi:hypothetical protein